MARSPRGVETLVRRTVVFAAAYALAIAVGRLTVLPETGLALFWPAAGIGVVWALRAAAGNERVVAGVLVGVMASIGNALTGVEVRASLIIGLANVLTSVGTAYAYVWLTDRYAAATVDPAGRALPLRRLGDVVRFLIAAGTAVTLSSGIGMVALAVAGTSVSGQTALGWVLRNGAAVIAFPGRSGPGQLYLASPYTVAASAMEGRIVAWEPQPEPAGV